MDLTPAKGPELVMPLSEEALARLLAHPGVQEFFGRHLRPQTNPHAVHTVGAGSGTGVIIGDHFTSWLYANFDEDSPGQGAIDQALADVVACVTRVHRRVPADDDVFAWMAPAALAQKGLAPPAGIAVQRFHAEPSLLEPPIDRIIAVDRAPLPASEVGLFGHPRRLSDGYAGLDARFVHPEYDDDSTIPDRLSLEDDLVPLFRGLRKGEDARGIVYVDAALPVVIDAPRLDESTVAAAVQDMRQRGVYQAGLGNESYSLTIGVTTALVFRADPKMPVALAVALAVAWSLVVNRGTLFLQGGRDVLGNHQFLLTP